MCDFINLVLPAQANIDALRPIVERHGRVLEPNSEVRVARELGADERAYLTTTRMCDCGTWLASRPVKSREHDEDRSAARLRRDGWSEPKIRRWREQRSEAIVRRTEARGHSRQDEVAMWIALIGELLDAKVAHVGLPRSLGHGRHSAGASPSPGKVERRDPGQPRGERPGHVRPSLVSCAGTRAPGSQSR